MARRSLTESSGYVLAMRLVISEDNLLLVLVLFGLAVWGAASILRSSAEKAHKIDLEKVRTSAAAQVERAKEEFRREAERLAVSQAKLELREWKADYAARIRRDAVARSRSALAGKLAESVAPFMPIFPYNPKDCRFLGNPIDYIVFDGLGERNEIDEVIFLEIKYRGSQLSTRQRLIRDAIIQGRVSWNEIRIDESFMDVAELDEFEDESGGLFDAES